jgi:hypothetical protein
MRETFSNLVLIGFATSLLIFPVSASAEIVQIGFTSEAQSISPGNLSGTFSIQLQDSSGSPTQADETFDIQFVSTSETGEFLSPTTETAATKTLSKGSANKNFRYRDLTPGLHTLTINARGRTSGLEVSGSQEITVMNGSPGALPSSGGSLSESGSINSSAKKAEVSFFVSAGKDRLGNVGSPMEFKAETTLVTKKKSLIRWNFGDGSEEYGEEIIHTYEYPGDYVVSLSAGTSEKRTINRINVKIIEPQLEIDAASPNKIEIKNASKQEVNLFGWVLWVKGRTFPFPQETFLKPGQTIAFSSRVTGLKPSSALEVELFIIGQTERPKINEKIEVLRQDKITALQYKIWELQEALGSRTTPPASVALQVPTLPISEDPLPITAAAAAAISEESDRGWFRTLKKFFLGSKTQ